MQRRWKERGTRGDRSGRKDFQSGPNGLANWCDTPKIVSEKEVRGATPWLLTFMEQWEDWNEKPLARLNSGYFEAEVRFENNSIWIVVEWPSGARLVCCAAYTPGSASLKEAKPEGRGLKVLLETTIGQYEVIIEFIKQKPLLHWRTVLTPRQALRMPFWPRDLYPIDRQRNPLETRGAVHTKQAGTRAGFLYASMTRPEPGSFLYMQNLSALNDYCEQTQTSPADRISDDWPELGFSLPPCAADNLKQQQKVVIADAYLMCSSAIPQNDLQSARQFLDLYAQLYLEYPKPAAVHRDWPRRVEETIHDLTHSPACTAERDGHRYVLAYVGDEQTPPESMVQLAVLVPLMEYAKANKEKIPCIAELQANLPTFWNPKIGAIGRWLPGHEHLLDGREDHLRENVMDSWYLYHAYLNLARVAEYDDKVAGKLFLESLEYGIKVARHFNYRWPVLYDIYTLEVIRQERAPGRDGEADVAGQYVHVMQQAFGMTNDVRYVKEAERAAQTLVGLGFELGYQYNNTAFGAGGLMWLWRQTGNELYRQLSDVCMAAIVQNFWLWECKYGYAKHYQTFMGMPPLRRAPYLALYEELELLSAFHEYFKMAEEGASPALRVLLPEYCKYLIDRAWYHYPSEIPRDVLSEKVKSGYLDRNLSIPLEDFYEGWQKAGQVGQQVYGAAAPFVFATRHSRVVRGENFAVQCSYPVREYKTESTGAHTGEISFRLEGDGRCRSHVRVFAMQYTPLPKVTVVGRDTGKAVKGTLTRFGYLEYEVPGNAGVRIRWKVDGTRPTKPKLPRVVNGRVNKAVQMERHRNGSHEHKTKVHKR